MAEFSVKQVAFNIGTSTQYVYQRMPELINKGMAYKDKKDKPIIYETGLNFLMEKRKAGLQVANKGLAKNKQQNEENEEETSEKDFASAEIKQLLETYKKLYEEQKQETSRWIQMYQEKDKALTEITSSLLLPAGQEEQQEQKSKKRKWGFWNRL